MLSRRKKQNLLYWAIGMLCGIATATLVAYFGIIANFTKDNIVKIYEVFPRDNNTIQPHPPVPIAYNEKQSGEQEKLLTTQTPLQKDSAETVADTTIAVETDLLIEEQPTLTIKTDVKIAESLIPIEYISKKDTANGSKPAVVRKGELWVEQWENPTNFAGYRKLSNKLIVYGIDINDITLQFIDDNLYLMYQDKRLLLKDSDTFLHYPTEFIH
jgi:hypothetical protein